MHEQTATNRREFVERLATGALALGVGAAASPSAALAASMQDTTIGLAKPDNSWMMGLKGNHAQMFDMPVPNGGFGLFHVLNYIDTYKSDFGLSYPNVIPIVSLYGMTTMLGINDAMWAKYQLGKALNINDRATKAPATRNVFAIAGTAGSPIQADSPIEIPSMASIPSLQARGARFILCNNALNFWVGRIAAGGGGNAADIRKDLLSSMLPKVTLVPAMVIAVSQAQAAGATYMFLT